MEATAATVFIIDDDPSVRKGLVRLLRSAGWNAEAFASAEAFLARTHYEDIGCIVLDLCMPGISGQQLQDLLRERNIVLPIVFLTGQGDIASSVVAMKKGAVDFLLKPIDSHALLQAISEATLRHAAALEKSHDIASIDARMARLSTREREVMEQVLTGRLNKQIAGVLGIAEKTVKVHRGRVMAKMEVHSVAQLVHECELVGINSDSRGAVQTSAAVR